ncbi:MAG TPA: TIGR03943 family protein [Chloroflexota bacterium]
MTVRVERPSARGLTLQLEVRRFLPPFILGGYGVFILSLFLRNVMSWYINPGYIGPTTLAGAVLVGIATVGAMRKPATACESCEDGCECGCSDSKPRVGTYALLMVPLLLAIVFPPRGLAAFSATQRGPQIAGMSAVHGMGTVKRVSLSVDTRDFSMQDWVGALSADPNPRDYTGKPVVVTGMVLHAPASVPPGYVMVMRYLITCCIADARPVGLVVQDTSHGALKDNQWVNVTGVMGAASDNGQKVAVVKPSKITVTRSGNPYIY